MVAVHCLECTIFHGTRQVFFYFRLVVFRILYKSRCCRPTDASSLRRMSRIVIPSRLTCTNARMIWMFTCIACSLLRTLESIATPCSVNSLAFLENFKDVTDCDILRISSLVFCASSICVHPRAFRSLRMVCPMVANRIATHKSAFCIFMP